MKKILILLAIALTPVFLQAQTTIDRAMSVWARDIVNANFTTSFEDIAALEATNDSSYVTMNIDTATVTYLIYEMPHVTMGFSDSAVTNDLTQNVWQVVTNSADSIFTQIEAFGITATEDSITILSPGDYMMIASLSFSGNNTDIYEFAIFKNGALASPKMERSTSSTDIGNVSLPFYIDGLVAGDDISLRYRNTANANDATLIACSWTTYLLHR